jgi:hypothetical protein
MTQHERILDYMREFGSITPIEAFRDLGITKLATRVGELKRLGFTINQEAIHTKNRYGEKTSYMSYSLQEEEIL